MGGDFALIETEALSYFWVIQRLTALEHRPNVCRSPVARDTLIHMVGLGKGISLMSEAIIAMPFPHVAFRPIAGNSDAPPFSGVWLPRNSNQALRRFIRLARTLSQTWKAQNKSAADVAREMKGPD